MKEYKDLTDMEKKLYDSAKDNLDTIVVAKEAAGKAEWILASNAGKAYKTFTAIKEILLEDEDE